MKIHKYFLITDTHYENPNPGDILIGKGIEYLITQVERRYNNFPIFNYINIFGSDDAIWGRVYKEADFIIVCGTPQLGLDHIPQHLGQTFYDKLWHAKRLGIIVANLWLGICMGSPTLNIPSFVERLYCSSITKFITKNFKLYDLIISRDLLTYRVLSRLKIENHLLIDSVFYSPYYYKINNSSESINIVVPRHIPSHNARIIDTFKKFDKFVVLTHDITDFNAYKEHFSNIICVNNPKSLVEIYSKASTVISLRVHGSVLATFFGAKVANISMDSRSNILSSVGIRSTSINNLKTLSFNRINIKPYLENNFNKFLYLFYNKCIKAHE